jgi:uncharacterized protein
MTAITRRRAILLAAGFTSALLPAGIANASSAGLRFEIYRGSNGDFRWRLKAGNGQVIATAGQGFSSKSACRNSIDIIVHGAATATIQDET